ncbi:MAG: hypothetical protein ACFFBD_20090 [Candidatus Hodarchaeota archaeon]
MRTLDIFEQGVFAGVIAIALFIIEFVVLAIAIENAPASQLAPTFNLELLIFLLIINVVIAIFIVFGLNFLLGRVVGGDNGEE